MKGIHEIRSGLGALLLAGLMTLLPAGRAHALDSARYLDITSDIRARILHAGMRTSYAIGDFNGDGRNDLAVGVPYATVSGQRAAGKVVVILGDRFGLFTPGEPAPTMIVFSQNAPAGPRKLPGDSEAGDMVGFSLAVGDFNGDGRDDLAVGAPGEDHSGIADCGAVFIGHGVAGGVLDFRDPGETYWQDGSGRFNLRGEAEAGDLLGFSLAAGNFNGDTRGGRPIDDLAIGVPGEDVEQGGERRRDAGTVVVAAGSANGIDGRTYDHPFAQHPDLDRYHLAGRAETGDLAGFSLAAADFNGDRFDDLAIGVPGENDAAGGVSGAKGSAIGLNAMPVAEGWHQDGIGPFDLPGSPEDGARVGFSLAAGDFNGDGRFDLAIGAPGRDIGSQQDAGAVFVAVGDDDSRSGRAILEGGGRITAIGSDFPGIFHQSARGNLDLPGSAEAGDLVGFSLAAGNFDALSGDRFDDLAIGAPGENTDAGAVMVRFGSREGGIASDRTPRLFTQTRDTLADDLQGGAEARDLLGLSLAAGRFGADAADELVISAPGERVANTTTLPIVLAPPLDRMLVDGFTAVIFGAADGGPDARVERQFFFNRYVVGGWVPAATVQTATVAAIDQAILQAEAASPIRVNLSRGPVGFSVSLPGTGATDTLGADFELSLVVAVLPDPTADVSVATRFTPTTGGITATAPFEVSVGPFNFDGTITRTIPVLAGITFTNVILLPDGSLEAVFVPNAP